MRPHYTTTPLTFAHEGTYPAGTACYVYLDMPKSKRTEVGADLVRRARPDQVVVILRQRERLLQRHMISEEDEAAT